MPSDPMVNPAGRDARTEVRAPVAYPAGPEKPQWLAGKLTFIGLAISTAGMLGKLFGLQLPADEANAFLRWLSENWETFAQGMGIIIAAYGRLRVNWRVGE